MLRFTVRLLLAFSLLFQSSQAKWPEEIRNTIPFTKKNSDPFIDTILGTCRGRSLQDLIIRKKVKGLKEITLNGIQGFESGSVKAHVFAPRGTNSRSELVVVLPGMFSSSSDGMAVAMGEILYKRGFDVLIPANPWSKPYIKVSEDKMGDVLNESARMNSMVAAYQKTLEKSIKLKSTHLVGISYGGFLGGVMVAKDAESGRNSIDGQVVLLGPPFKTKISLSRLDRFINLSFKKKKHILKDLAAFKYFCDSYRKEDFDLNNPFSKIVFDRLRDKALRLTASRGFYDNLRDSVDLFDQENKVGLRPSPEEYGNDYQRRLDEWLKNIRFGYYFKNYAPQVGKLLEKDISKLAYWNQIVQMKRKNPILVMTAENDFLNEETEKFSTFGEELLILPSGGHVGYLFDQWTISAINRVLQ